tara:strand:- start:318 stop:548 length:231 start_codon:yes stop_codon:yes gene_type:complete
MPKNKKKRKKQHNKYLVLSSASFQFGVTIYLGSYIGKTLDAVYVLEKKWFTILFVLLAFLTSIYSLIKQLNKLNDE